MFTYARHSPAVKTVFSQYSDDFYLAEDGQLKLKDIPKDDQAVIDSYFSTRLEALLDKYSDVIAGMNGYNIEFSDEVVDIDNQKRDLDRILAVDALIDEYKSTDEKYAKMSRDAIIKELRVKYDSAIKAYYEKLAGKSEQKVEDKPNEEEKVES